MIRVFIGYDERQPVAYNVCAFSVARHAVSEPVAITPLRLPAMPIKRRGLTEFTFSRFLVPYLSGYEGWSVFIDSDMLVTADVADLIRHCREAKGPASDVFCATHLPAFERPAVMVFDNARCRKLTPEYVEADNGLFGFDWACGEIGTIPPEWHHCIGYEPMPEMMPKLLHWTQGIPCHWETAQMPFADVWRQYASEMGFSIPWADMMGNSVHAAALPSGLRLPKHLLSETMGLTLTQKAPE